MKKFIVCATLISLGLSRLDAQQSQQSLVPQQPVTTQGQPITQGQPGMTQGQPAMPQGQPTTPQGQPATTPQQPVTTPGQPIIQGQPTTQGQPAMTQGQLVTPGTNFVPVTGITVVHINLIVLGQGATNTSGGPALHFTQTALSDNDILGLINEEFGTTFSTTNGDQLAVHNFLDGKFLVVGTNNNVLLSDASTTANNDHYHLNFSSGNTVTASQESTNATIIFSVTDGSLNYISGDGTNTFRLAGLTMINDTFFHGSGNSSETFALTGGSGSISFPNSTNVMSGVLTGNIAGSGQNNASTP